MSLSDDQMTSLIQKNTFALKMSDSENPQEKRPDSQIVWLFSF